MTSVSDWLRSSEGYAWLALEYVQKERSTHSLAAERGCHAKTIARALHHHGLPIRDRSAAQRAAIESGRHPHPTQGTELSEETRRKISEAKHLRRIDEEARRHP